jgi:hypothetical protein
MWLFVGNSVFVLLLWVEIMVKLVLRVQECGGEGGGGDGQFLSMQKISTTFE